MKIKHGLQLGVILLVLSCVQYFLMSPKNQDQTVGAPDTARAAVPQLSDADQALADAQHWCPVMEDSLLGSMGTPIKVMVDDTPVFLCCEGCGSKALASATKTIAKVEQHKRVQMAFAGLSAADREAAESQKYCPIMKKSRLGTMGTPIKLTVDGQVVFLCCEHCQEKAQADPQATVAVVARLKQESLR